MLTKTTNDKEFFYKYVTAEVAVKILTELQIKWSSPLIFNDPFDFQIKPSYGFESRDIIKPLTDELTAIIFSGKKCGRHEINYLRSIKGNVPEENFKKVLESQLKVSFENIFKALGEYKDTWDDQIKRIRLFCIAEEADNLLMWSHYSDSHKGAVIKFRCMPQNSLSFAKKVSYTNEIPFIANAKEFIDHFVHTKIIDIEDTYFKFACTKSDHWSYEKEWRCVNLQTDENGELFEFGQIIPEEIESVYLGLKMPRAVKKEIIKIIKRKLKHVNIYLSKKDSKEYKLNFELI